jgi:hypothetical protein
MAHLALATNLLGVMVGDFQKRSPSHIRDPAGWKVNYI